MLRVEEVYKSFGGLVALAGVSIEVEAGEILGLIGPNGSGKTTLFNVIAGSFPPAKGRLWLDGRDITWAPPHIRARLGIARTYQIPRPFWGFSALENVLVALAFGRNMSFSQVAVKRALSELEKVGLEKKANVPMAQLTLVELKRLELARALALEPRFLLLDEVFSGLNPAEVEAAQRLIKQIVQEKGTGIVVVEHNMRIVMGLCKRVVVLSLGRKIAEGNPGEVVRDPEVVRIYLGERRA